MPVLFSSILKFIRYRTIASRLLFYILLVSFLFTLAGTTLQLYIDYQSDLDIIERQIKQIETSYLRSLTKSTWDMDIKGVSLGLEGALQLDDIKYLEIKTELGTTLASKGAIPPKKLISRRFPLIYDHLGKKNIVGTLDVVATLEGVYARLWKKIFIISSTQAIQIFCVAVFILFIFQYLITRHLKSMAKYTEAIGLDNLEQPLILKRKVTSGQEKDELDVVVKAFNEMRENLIKDIKQREEAEEALRKSEEQHRTLIELMNDSLFAIDLDRKITYANPKAVNMFGYSQNELIGSDLAFLFDEPNQEILKEQLTKRKKRENNPYEIELTAKDGHKVSVIMSPQILTDTQGEYSGSMAVITDITTRKKMEEELKEIRNYLDNIINSMPSVLISVTQDGNVVHWNHEAEKRTGIAAAEALGKSLSQVYPSLSGEMEHIRKAIDSRRMQKTEKVLWKYGEEKRFSDIMVYPLVSNGAKGAVIRVDDTTEKVRMEEMLIHGEKMISVGSLAAGMAHEINNPLGIILQGAQNIERRIAPDFIKNQKAADECGIDLTSLQAYLEKRNILTYISEIRKSGLRAAEIISNLLQFSQRSDSSKTNQDLAKLLNRTLELADNDYNLKKSYDFRNIKIVKEFDQNLPRVFCIDTEIEQVILNLLRNAVHTISDYSKAEEPKIIIRARQEEKSVRIEVEDNGKGIDDSTRRRIFDPFFTTKPVGKGTGLGLFVSYMIITRNHNGTMEVESKPDIGTRFIIRLPL
ncbi:PAS domain S-box protein [bacterium]|nr:PAS domain S-box protein [bacterium]